MLPPLSLLAIQDIACKRKRTTNYYAQDDWVEGYNRERQEEEARLRAAGLAHPHPTQPTDVDDECEDEEEWEHDAAASDEDTPSQHAGAPAASEGGASSSAARGRSPLQRGVSAARAERAPPAEQTEPATRSQSSKAARRRAGRRLGSHVLKKTVRRNPNPNATSQPAPANKRLQENKRRPRVVPSRRTTRQQATQNQSSQADQPLLR